MTGEAQVKAILLVDDDPDFCEVTRTRLEASGYRVRCARDGVEALEILEGDYQPHLMILDIEMPNKNGLSTLINMKVRLEKAGCGAKLKIPVLIATGLRSQRIRELLESEAVSDYILKPFNSDELIQKVSRLIEA